MGIIKSNAAPLSEEDAAKLTPFGACHYTAGKSIKERLHDYEGFLKRIQSHGEDAPKTTDECFTPPHIYGAVVEWLAERVDLTGRRIVRPFVPGGDFEAYPYQEGDIVIDNPPFSILAYITRFYLDKHISFFLFAPGLTLWNNTQLGEHAITHVVTGYSPTFANDAKIQIGFRTNLFPGTRVIVAPSLAKAMREAEKAACRVHAAPRLAKYVYPPEIWSPATLGTLAKNGGFEDISIPVASSRFLRSLAQQRLYHKNCYGGGLMVDRATAERLQEAKTKAKTKAKAKAEAVQWQYTPEEVAEIDRLDAQAARLAESSAE